MSDPGASSARPRVLITGAAGFIGKNLSRHLADCGYPLTLVTRREEPLLQSLSGARVLLGATRDALAGEVDLAEHGALVHLASSTNPRFGAMTDELQQLGDLGRLLEAAREVPGLDVVYLSSGGTVYRDEGHAAHRETDPLDPQSLYGWGKVAAENLIGYYARTFGLRYKIVRPSNPYGPEQPVHKRQGLVMKLLYDVLHRQATEIWGDGEELRDYFFVTDLCALVEKMIRRPDVSGVYNAGSGTAVSVNDVIDAVALSIGIRPQVKHADRVEGAVSRSVLDTERTSREFDWQAEVPLAEGVRATWEWLVQNA
jgi:UDP-glucose 4-epimerase